VGRLVPAAFVALLAPLGAASALPPAARDTAGRLAEQLGLARQESDPVLRARAEAAVFYAARDFVRVLRAVEDGLRADPDDLVLLWRGAGAELWLQDGGRALALAERLERAAREADVADEERAGWLEAARAFQDDALGFLEREVEGRAALRRSRVTIAVVAALGLVALAASARSRGPASRPAGS
jgi:hypothetical protein